ncbi:hypothetical protein [Leadbettera azotonutricia]|uniref:Putative membrane protein n=1 Tax=Leadbettera azotonutricia (strain ATCC BAA-888 / DSM 13862 / ZAS-9) TaxID=545695 RepID=F5YD94_LEAAZ|nr:hypothetical protein [Leadbettera azotonutricia]AEF82737.1 putative membrane protein [Leadbettera azotonutricia ZAS-9]
MAGTSKYWLKNLFLCVLLSGGNCLLNILVNRILGLPLFLDTLFTLTVTFLSGPVFGIISAILTSAVGTFLLPPYMPIYSLYVLCSITGVALTEVFCRSYKLRLTATQSAPADADSGFGTFTALLLLSVVLCLQMSIMGGCIAALIPALVPIPGYTVSPENYFKLGLLINNMPVLAAEIISRLPINIFDRLLSVFGGYGLALLIRKLKYE